MRNILVRRGVYPWTISPEPRKGLGRATDNSVRSADAIEIKRLYVGHICLKRVIGAFSGCNIPTDLKQELISRFGRKIFG